MSSQGGLGMAVNTSWAGRRVVVVGLGVSGFAAARALAELKANVVVTESSSGGEIQRRARELVAMGVEVVLGGHDPERLEGDLAVVSPGIPPAAPVVQALQARGLETISEIELASRLAPCDFLAVTGTNGKTTTTSILAAILRESGIASQAAGNIGWPLVDAVLAVPPGGVIAVEVSSFQLATIDTFRPRVAVLLNIAEDHTDWHGSVDSYARAKGRLTKNQTAEDTLVVNYEDPRAMRIAEGAAARVLPFSATRLPPEGIGVSGESIVWRDKPLLAVGDVPLAGLAGVEDALAAAGAALEYGVDAGAVNRAIKKFRPLAHRLQTVAEIEGVTYIDDSKATNPHATIAAVQGLSDVVLIAGGRSKGMDLEPLAATVPPVTAVVALGEAKDEIARVFERLVPVEGVASMSEAVRCAHHRSVAGGSVLLSPACASLDMYESYAARGEEFAKAVEKLLDEEEKAKGD